MRERYFDRSGEVEWYTTLLDSTIRVQDSLHLYIQDSFYGAGPYELNNLSAEHWSASGLSRSESNRLLKYLSAGGKIYNEESLKRINLGDSAWRKKIMQVLVMKEPDYAIDYSTTKYWNADWQNKLLTSTVNVHDPDSVALVNSGLPTYMVSRWKKFVGSGVQFDSLAEVLSIWGMDTGWYFMNLDSLTLGKEVEEKTLTIPLNTLEEEALSQVLLYEWQRKKWLKYRDRLGGYVDAMQFWECGLDSNSVRNLLRHTWEKGGVKKIDLNTASIEDMNRHPYIGWQRAQTVDYYRTRVRPIENPEVLVGLEGWTEEDLERLREYLE